MKKITLLSIIFIFAVVAEAQIISLTDSMSTARRRAQSQVLNNGKVLVFGGDNSGSTKFNSAELYDPSTGHWSPAANMNDTRTNFASVLLNNGKVLAISGDPSGGTTCELYDPSNNTWSYTGSLATTRNAPGAVKLANGNVLVVGGYQADSSEIYDVGTGQWHFNGEPQYSHSQGPALTLLSDGKVLCSGGTNELANEEIYDPGTNQWSTCGPSGSFFLDDPNSILLNNGKVLIYGSYSGGLSIPGYIFDPATGIFDTTTTPPYYVGWHVPAVLLNNGKALIWSLGNGFDSDLCQIYDPSTNSWSAVSNGFEGAQQYCIAKLPNNKVLIMGGQGTYSESLSRCLLIDGDMAQVGIKPVTAPNVSIFPNPTTGFVRVEGKLFGSPESKVEVFDVTGQAAEINYAHFSDGITFNIGHLSNGIYVVKCTSKASTTFNKIELLK